MEEKIKVVTGSIALAGGAYVSAAAMFAVSVLMARYMDKDSFGLYLFVLSAASLLSIFTDLGIDGVSSYFIMRYKDNQINLIRYVIYTSAKLKIILISIVFFILLLLGFTDYRYWYVAVFFIILVPNSFVLLITQSFQHFRFFGQIQIIESTLKLFLIYYVLTNVTTWRLSIIILAIVLPMILSVFLAIKDTLKLLPKEHISINFEELKKEARDYWIWFTALSVMTPVIGNVMQISLGLLKELDMVAVFGVGKTLSNMVLIFVSSFKTGITPSFIKKTDRKSIAFALTDSIRYMLMVVIFMAFFIHFTSAPLVTLFYTQKYSESTIIFEILSYGTLITLVFAGVTPAITSIGKQDMRVKLTVLYTILLIIFSFIVVPKYGALGAALVFSISTIIINGSYAILAKKYLNFKFPVTTLFKCIIAALLALVPMQLVELSPLIRISINFLMGIFLYLLLLFLFNEIKTHDINLLKESSRRIRNYIGI